MPKLFRSRIRHHAEPLNPGTLMSAMILTTSPSGTPASALRNTLFLGPRGTGRLLGAQIAVRGFLLVDEDLVVLVHGDHDRSLRRIHGIQMDGVHSPLMRTAHLTQANLPQQI